MKMIERLIPRMSRAVNAAWKNDRLFTPIQLRAGDKEFISVTCAGGLPAPVATIPLIPKEHPDRPLVIAGICEIRGKRTVIFEQPDTIGPKSVAEKTLSTYCDNANCAKRGCALLGEKTAASQARKRPRPETEEKNIE